jgi:hypothetical protein
VSVVLRKVESVMAEKKKKKAYQRFEELIKQTAPTPAEVERDPGLMNRGRSEGPGPGQGSLSPEALPIWLSPEVRRALEHRAAAEGTTPSEIVQQALRRYLESPR